LRRDSPQLAGTTERKADLGVKAWKSVAGFEESSEMVQGLNKVMIIGFVGREPEMRYTPSGKPVTSFSVATSRTWTASDGRQHEETDWFNVVSWGSLAETCKQSLAKDQRVYIEGRLQTRGWKDSQGKRHYRTEIVANEMIILDQETSPEPVLSETDSSSLPAEEQEHFFDDLSI
jgi:single-strand DNA-binding protein